MAFCLGVECKPGEYKVSLGTDANNCQMQPICVVPVNLDPETTVVKPDECDKSKGEIWCNWGFDEAGVWLGSYCAEECV